MEDDIEDHTRIEIPWKVRVNVVPLYWLRDRATCLDLRIHALETLAVQSSVHLVIQRVVGSEVRCKADAELAGPFGVVCGPVEKDSEPVAASRDAAD